MSQSKSPDGLTDKQRRFVAEYMVDCNARAAAVRAGYSARTADKIGPQLLGKTSVRAAIAKREERHLQRLEVTAERVLAELGRLSVSDPRQLFDAEGNLRPIHELPDEVASAVASVEVIERTIPGTKGEVERVRKVRLWDKNAALGNLARHFKLLTEKIEHSGAVGVLTPEQAAGLSDDELARKAADLAARAAALSGALAGQR